MMGFDLICLTMRIAYFDHNFTSKNEGSLVSLHILALILQTQRYIEACTAVTEPVVAALTPLTVSSLSWDDLTPAFYTTFWSLTMADSHVPTQAYAKQINQLRLQMVNIEENNDMVRMF